VKRTLASGVLLAFLVACARGAGGAASAKECVSPTPERIRPEPVPDSVRPDGSAFYPLRKRRAVDPAVVPNLAGTFDLTVISTNSRFWQDTIVQGELVLRPAPAKYRKFPNPDVEAVYFGTSSVNLRRLGPVNLAHSASSAADTLPGVEVTYSKRDSALALSFGNSMSNGNITLDAGVFFEVFYADSSRMTGRWIDGSANASESLPQGYFCASRVHAES
jgi:hypothetical protein